MPDKYCSPECKDTAICDFCINFEFNGDEDGAYTDDGYCKFHKRAADPVDNACSEFHCMSAKTKQIEGEDTCNS